MCVTQNERISLPIWKKLIITIITLVVFALQLMLFIFTFQITYSNELNKLIYILIELLSILL